MTTMGKSLFLTLFSVFSILCATGCVQAQGMFSSPLTGQVAPDFSLQKVKGGSASLQEEINGKKAVIIFWATWCPHCREQLQVLHDNKASLEAQQISVILVNIGESKSQVERFLASKGYGFDVFMDVDSSAAETYQILGIPTIVLIGADGKVRDVQYQFPEDYQDILK